MSDPSSPSKPARPASGPAVRPHTYDGIEEFDQKLPNWWLFTLYIAIAFSLVYWFWNFQIQMPSKAYIDDYKSSSKEVAVVRELEKKSTEAATAGLDDAALWVQAQDPAVVEAGKTVYGKICFSCHGFSLDAQQRLPDGTAVNDPATGKPLALPGLSLVDAEWKYGSKPLDMIKTVTTGTPNPAENLAKGQQVMPPKGGLQLLPEEIKNVVVFLLSHLKQAPDNCAVPKG